MDTDEESSGLSLSSETKACCVKGITLCIVVGFFDFITSSSESVFIDTFGIGVVNLGFLLNGIADASPVK